MSPDEIDEVGTLKDGRRIHVKGKAWDAIVRERGWSAVPPSQADRDGRRGDRDDNRGDTVSDTDRAYYVTSTPTICDGTVIRWFTSEAAMQYGNPVASASRNGVMGHHEYLTPELFEAAWQAHLLLKRGADVSHLATHRSKHLFGDEYVPIGPS